MLFLETRPARRSRGLVAVAAWAAMASATPAAGQAPEVDTRVEVLTIGQIDRIDREERSFRIRTLGPEPEAPSDPPRRPVQVGPISISVGVGITRNNVSLGAGAGEPAPDTERREPGTSRLPQAVPTPDPESANDITTRVFTSQETRFHQDGVEIRFEALATGDRVTVRGLPRGNDIQAGDVARQAPAPARN